MKFPKLRYELIKKNLPDKTSMFGRTVQLLVIALTTFGIAWLVPQGGLVLFNHLFTVWGVDSSNIARAPMMIRWLSSGWTFLVSMLQGALLICVMIIWGRRASLWIRPDRNLCRGLLAGAAAAFLLTGAFMGLDVMRFDGPIGEPDWNAFTFVMLTATLLQAAGAVMATAVAAEVLASWGSVAAWLGSAAFYALLFGGLSPLGIINALLAGFLIRRSKEKKGGYSLALGFLMALTAIFVLLGYPVRPSGALYEFYPVSKEWLTGGEAGPWAGIGLTGIFALLIAVLEIPNRRSKAAAPARPSNARPSGQN